MINPYQYSGTDTPVSLIPRGQNALWNHFGVEFASTCKTSHLGANKLTGEYFFPRGPAKAPLTILIHGMGDRSIFPCRLIARDLARKGIASFILYLVFHSVRAPDSIRLRYPDLTAEEWFESYVLSVTDIRQILDWAGKRPEIIHSQISLLGISFGSFISTIVMALDSRINKGILVECGGNSEKITKDSWLLRWRYKQGSAVYRQNQEAYSAYLREVAGRGWDKVEAPRSSFLTDPLTFASNLKGRPLMMINSAWDEIIPRTATIELWESLGRPPIYWYPATHASLWVWYAFFRHKITAFIKNGG